MSQPQGNPAPPPRLTCSSAQALLATIGNTPLVELPRVRPRGGARILAKLEGGNPGGR